MPAPFDRDQAIREAAYALFEARGGEPGHELDDWLQAEARVLQANGESAPASGVAQVAQRVRLVRGRATASREKTA